MSDPRTAEILAVDAQRRAALIACDLPVLDRLFADDMIHIHSTGYAGGKAAYLHDLQTIFEFIEIDRHDLEVRFLGDVALLTGPMTHRVRLRSNGDIVIVDAFGSQIWVPCEGGWKQVFYQATVVKPAD